MGDGSSAEDDTLLARLNALKQTKISLASNPLLSSTAVEDGTDDSPEDLIARFQRLHGRGTSARKHLDSPPHISPEDDDPPSPTIDELLAQLGEEKEHELDRSELVEARNLLTEAKNALPTDPKSITEPGSKEQPNGNGILPHDPPPTELDEDAEAEEALQRILDEAGEEDPEEEKGKEVPTTGNAQSTNSSATHDEPPFTSSSAPQFPTPPESNFDTLDLPAPPSTAPIRQTKPKAKPISDQEIETWCIICCNNANVRCLGCDNDLYCWGCWRKGHTGEDASLEEKQHAWETYKKPPG